MDSSDAQLENASWPISASAAHPERSSDSSDAQPENASWPIAAIFAQPLRSTEATLAMPFMNWAGIKAILPESCTETMESESFTLAQ